MMKRHLIFFSILTATAACTTVVDFDIPVERPKVVINSLFSPDSVWQIQISRAKHVLDNRQGSYFDPVTDASVSIRDQDNVLIETITGSFKNLVGHSYIGKTKPLPGKLYVIQVEVNNETSIKAINKVPTLVPITSFNIDSSRFIAEGEAIEIEVNFKDPAEEKNFYTIKIIEDAFYVINKDTVWFPREIYYVLEDPTLNSEFSEPDKYINDNLFNGKNNSLHLKIYFYGSNFTSLNLRLALVSISEEYYKYFTTKSLQDNTNGDPFAQPVQVFSNIENGLGIFAGYSSSVVELK